MREKKLEEMNVLSINNLKIVDKVIWKDKKNKILFDGFLLSFMVKIMRERKQSLFDFMFSCGRTGDKLFKVL